MAAPVPPLATAKVPAVMDEAFIVPETVKVAPDGTVIVSPEVPSSKVVPVLGSTLSTFNVLIYTITKFPVTVTVPVKVTVPATTALSM